jgi:putative SOS response-associated peptidase YedK
MCGRYSIALGFVEVCDKLGVEVVDFFRDWRPTYNITPNFRGGTEQPIIVRSEAGSREARLARWWFIPEDWSQPFEKLPSSFNARVEDLHRRPFFRTALRSKRCMVPASGWREFKGERRNKQAYHFRLADPLFAFAGLWSTYHSPVGEVIDSYSIITTDSSAGAAEIHDRMPLILSPDHYGAWLDSALDSSPILTEEIARSQTRKLDYYPSNPIGNNGRFEGPEVIQPATSGPRKYEQLSLFDSASSERR